MSIRIFSCKGGSILLPDRAAVLISRQDGGNLVIYPPRVVWERSELLRDELQYWSYLVAAAGKAMLDTLTQLRNGCLNYWEAGNWALNDQAFPVGRKTAREFRKMHLHLLGRSPESADPSWQWGESPKFPMYADRFTYSSDYERLMPDECFAIVRRAEEILTSQYLFSVSDIGGWNRCKHCTYPMTQPGRDVCEECG